VEDGDDTENDAALAAWMILSAVGGWLYFALMESSPAMATLGKRAAGIVVVEKAGKRISFGRASGRYFARYITWCTLLIGFLAAAFTGSRRALHDVLSGTRVVRR
jgi:uncharacterized RDD family membrane protein YckC